MAASDDRPVFGFRQPTNGFREKLDSKYVRGEKKTPKTPGFMRVVVAANVGRLLDHHYRHLPTLTQRQRALAKDCGVGFGTVQRIMKHEVGASLDNIESICDALQVQLYQLLLPSLDARNP